LPTPDQTPPESFEVLKKRELTLGRSTNNDLVLSEEHISREHAKVWMDEGGVWIQDLGSRNGTYLNDIRLGALPVAVPARKDIESWVSTSTIRLGRSELTLDWPVFYDWPHSNEARDRFDLQGFDSSCRYWETEIGYLRTPDHFGNRLRMGIRAFASGDLPQCC
jgi:pSer/pThr/pTyr-binding forkhead associated (FHA) protein